MALTTPQVPSFIEPFPATEDYTFKFSVIGGDQCLRNNIQIQSMSDNTIVFDNTIESFTLSHLISQNTLQNGVNYKLKVRTGNVNGEWSSWSEWTIFYCFENPVVTIPNLVNDEINNQTFIFEGQYEHSDSLQSYKYLLYDSNKNLVSTSEEKFDGLLKHEFAGFENDVLYYIELKTISIHGMNGSSELIPLKAKYIAPRLLTTLVPENLSNEGAIKISATLIQIIGKVYDRENNQISYEDIEYIDDDWLPLTSNSQYKIVYEKGFDLLESNFILQLWCRDIVEDMVFLKIFSPYGTFELRKYNNRIHAFKYITGIEKYPAHFVSNEFLVGEGEGFTIWLKHINNLLDIKAEIT